MPRSHLFMFLFVDVTRHALSFMQQPPVPHTLFFHMPSKKPWVANEQLSIDIFFSSSTKSKSASASGRKNSATKRKQRTTTNLDPDAICNDVDLDPVGPSAKRVNTVLDDEQDFPLNFASRASSSKVKPSYGLATPAPAQTTREVFPTTQHTSSRRKAQARRISVQNTLQTPSHVLQTRQKMCMVCSRPPLMP